MDFRYCPSCKQSVLDDDAAECPFCGAAMDGKGGGSSKPPAATKKTSESSKKSASKSSKSTSKKRPAKTAKDSGGDDDDPFGVVEASAVNAIQSTVKPGKGRLHKIVCPMCDSVGFVPKSAVGKDVRCANEECLVPVFKAPSKKSRKSGGDPRKAGGKTPSSSDDTKSRSPLVLYGSIVALVVAGGLGTLFFLTDKGKTGDLDTPFDIPVTKKDTEAVDPLELLDKNKDVGPVVDNQPTDYAAVRDGLIEKAIKTAREPGNRDKPYARRLTADAHATAGHVDAAERELKQLERLDSRRRYFTIQPLSRIAWGQIQAGDVAAADATIQRATEAMSRMPGPILRTQMDMVTALGSVLVGRERFSEADQLLKNKTPDKSLADSQTELELSAVVSVMRELQVEGLDQPIQQNTSQWVSPRRTAIAGIAQLKGATKQALGWVAQQNANVRVDCLSLCAEIACMKFRASGSRSEIEEVAAAAAKIGPAESRLVDAVSARCLATTSPDDAKALLEKIKPGFMEVDVPDERETPRIAEVLKYTAADTSRLRLMARTGREMLAAFALTKQPAVASEILPRALQFARGMAPPWTDSQELLKDSNDTSRMTRRLKSALSISNDNAARRQLSRYRSIVRQIANSSEQRRLEITTILTLAARNGLSEDAWKFTQQAENDAIMDSLVPWSILDGLEAENKDASAVKTAYRDGGHQLDALNQMQRNLNAALQQKSPAQAANAVRRSNATNTQRFLHILRLVLKHSEKDQLESTMQFIKELDYPPFREEAIDLFCARAIKHSDSKEILQLIELANFGATEQVAACHGLAVGANVLNTNAASEDAAPKKK